MGIADKDKLQTPTAPRDDSGENSLVFPLSFQQQRLWFLDELEPGNSTYNITWSIRVTGMLNRSALEASISEVVRRHEILRSTYGTQNGQPVQVVQPSAKIKLSLVDLTHIALEHRESEVQRLVLSEAKRPTDLHNGSVIRASLLGLGDQDHVLVLSTHHIAFDGWSRMILVRELADSYEAFSQGKPPSLPELPLQYGDFAVWQREHLQGKTLEKQLSYWKQQLAGAPASLDLPTDRPRPAVQSYHGANAFLRLRPALTEGLKALSRQEGVTLFMTLLAAFQVLLSRYSGHEDVVVGTPMANRGRPELEKLIGFFANTLALRTNLSGNPTFREVLERVKEVALGAYANQDMPFEKLVEELNPERSLSHNPVFQVLFSLQNATRRAWELKGLTLTPLDSNSGTAKFDLSLFTQETPDGLEGRAEYNTDLFDRGTIERMMEHFKVLLENVVAHPELRLGDIPLLPETERQRLLVEWNSTAADFPRERCLHELFERQAERRPNAAAVCFDDEELTYDELNQRANRLARYLRREGIGRGLRVGIYVERSINMMVGLLGIQKSGAAYVPLDPAYPSERLRLMLEDAQVPIVLTQESLLSSMPEHRAKLFCLDRDWEQLNAESVSNPVAGAGPEDVVYVIFTSGSTGRPKGVQVPHRAVVNLMSFMQKELGMSERDVFPALASFAFDMCIPELYLPLVSGGKLALARRELAGNGEELKAFLERHRATILHATPSTWSLLLDEGFTGKGLKRAIGAEPLPQELFVRLMENGEALYNFYGPTETTVWSTFYRFTSKDEPVTVGRPLANTEVYLLDRNLHPVPIGVVGEIHIGGLGVTHGYLNKLKMTAEKFISDPFGSAGGKLYKTGDLGRYLPDGRIEFLGRADNQVKLRGFRIELGDIEAALASHATVADSVVIAREDRPGDKRLVGYVIPASEQCSFGDLRAFLKERLPDYMVPTAFVMLDKFPLNANGKVDLRALPAPELEAMDVEAATTAPCSPVEEVVAEAWAEVLRLAQVRTHDNFFDLGGHSLLATQVISRLRRTFQIDLPLRLVFESPTVAGMAKRIESLQKSQAALPQPPVSRISRDGTLPLSFGQQRLWFLQQLEPENPLYNIPIGLRFAGKLDQVALERSLNEIVRRHEVLRTTFSAANGEPLQVIRPAVAITISVTDLTGESQEMRDERARELASEQARTAFDLDRDLPIRVCLLRLRSDDHLLVLVVHHVAFDRWSTATLVRELTQLYEAFSQNQPSPLPELPVQYADFAAWQRNYLKGEVLDKQLAYWRQQLVGAPASLELPTDRARPALRSFRGDTEAVVIPKGLLDSVRRLGRSEGATLFMTVFAAFNVLLHRYSGQDDIVVGSPIAGRNKAEIEELVGFFVNTLALRTDLSGDPTFQELLNHVREVTIAAYAHQDLPFDKLVEELRLDRDLSRTPLFQVMFILQNVPEGAREVPGLAITPAKVGGGSSKFDLTVTLAEKPDGARVAFQYNTDIFEASTIRRMIGHFLVLLKGIVAEPQQRISRLPLLTPEERQQVVVDWNRTERTYPPVCVHQLIEAQVERTPKRIAAVFEEKELSYEELNRRANQLARYLRNNGVRRNVLVGLTSERSLETVIAVLAVLKAGGAYVPLDPEFPRERLAVMVNDAKPAVILTQERLREIIRPITSHVFCLDSDWHRLATEDTTNPATTVNGDDICYVLYTSGSTGTPKGVPNTHRGVVNQLLWRQDVYRLGPADRVLQKTPYTFDVSVWEFFWTLMSGATMVIAHPGGHRDPMYLADLIQRQQITTLHFVPSMLRFFLETEGVEKCTSLRQVFSGGEALTAELEKRFFERLGAELNNLYGPTEAAIDVAHYFCRPREPHASVPIGRPVANTRLYILDRNLQPVPVGVPGELHIASSQLAHGYLNRPELTQEKFIPDPFATDPASRLYKTGDLTRYLPDGNIQFLGRIDHQVKIRGFRIELGEIESVLGTHPGVKQTAVIVREDVPGDGRLVAYVVPAADTSVASAGLRAYLKDRLPEHMVPAAFVLLNELPLTVSGKLDRRKLPMPEYEQDVNAQHIEPRTPTEEVVAAIWAEVLRLNEVGVHDNFFELGGHSLLATQVVSRIRRMFQIDIPLRTVFEHPTVAAMAERIELVQHAAEGLEVPPIVPCPRDGRLPLSFGQQRLWFLDRLEPESALYNVPFSLHLEGQLDVFALERSLAEIVRRHEVLRTNITLLDGEPVQEIRPVGPVTLSVTDLTTLPQGERQSHALRLVTEKARQPFSLEYDSLMRASLLRLTSDRHVLVLTFHHVVFDGWSAGVFLSELSILYQAFSNGGTSPLADLPVQYADYAAWQRSYLQGEALDKQLSYWRGQLADAPTNLELPTDHPRPTMQTFRGSDEFRIVPRSVLDALKQLSCERGCTLFMTLLAGFNLLLQRYTGQDDIVVGSAIAGRNRCEIEKLIGFFVNTLVLRTKLDGDPTVWELLARVREVTIGAYGHQDVPFEKLVEELRPERDASRTPLFQAMFALQNAPTDEHLFSELTVKPYGKQNGVAKYDLTVTLTEKPEGLRTNFSYNADLFDPSTITRMLEHFETLLEEMAADPKRSISQLNLLTAEERQRMLVDWNATSSPYPRDSIGSLFEEQAHKTPQAVAVVLGNKYLTYEELDRRATWVAQQLEARGVKCGSLVGICAERSLEMIIGVVGIVKAGAAYLPLDPAYPKDRLAFMIEDAGVELVLTNSDLIATLPTRSVEFIRLDANSSAQLASGRIESEASLDTLAYVMYTSGSTGKPKGVMVPQRAIVRLLFGNPRYAQLDEKQVFLQLATLSFDASTLEIWGALLHGGRCVLFPGKVPTTRELEQILKTQGVTILFLTTALFNTLIDEAPQALSSVAQLLVGGEAASVPHVRRALALLPKTKISNVYGPTESTTFSSYYPISEPIPGSATSIPIGRPIGNTQLYILDRSLKPVPPGVVGELYIGGDGLACGYLNEPELTSQKFVPSPFDPAHRIYKTGDLVRLLPDGNIDFVGRIDHQVKIRGFRIELGEVEGVLSSQSEVRETLVMAREDVPGVKTLVAYVVARQQEDGLVARLKNALREKLPEYMMPSAFVVLEEFPLSATGKINRLALPAPEYVRHKDKDGSRSCAPTTPFEAVLVNIWEKLLGVHPIGVKDNFFDLGGHSLLAVRLIAEVQKTTGREIPLSAFFREATIEHLAAIMNQGPDMLSYPLVMEIRRPQTLDPEFSKAPFFCVSAPGVNALGYVALTRHLHPDQPVYKLQAPRPGKPSAFLNRPYTSVEWEAMADEYLEAMRRVQPHGPYLMGGMCGGARIAFEMARKLEAEGEQIGLLAVFDTWVMENTQIPVLWRMDDRKNRLRSVLRMSVHEQLDYVGTRLLNGIRSLRRKLHLGARAEKPRPSLPNLWRQSYWPGPEFVPKLFGGKVTVLRLPKQPWYRIRDFQLGWGSRALGGVEVHVIDVGEHVDLLREPHVATLARELNKCLEKANGNGNCRVAAASSDSLSNVSASAAITTNGDGIDVQVEQLQKCRPQAACDHETQAPYESTGRRNAL